MRTELYLPRKVQTVIDYVRMGLYLGRDSCSKVLLSTMLLFYKLSIANSVVCRVRLKKYIRGVLCFRPPDIGEVYEILWREGYWFEQMQRTDLKLKNVLDLGAHIGLFTVWLKSKYPRTIVYCFEPDPESYILLEENTSELSGVLLQQEAVGVSSGESMFFIDPKRHALSSFKESPRRIAIRCSVRALDDLLDILGIVDLIKFDIEGSEYEVFSRSSLAQDVNHLVGEVHGNEGDIGRFLDLFPYHCKHVKGQIVYLHKTARGVCEF